MIVLDVKDYCQTCCHFSPKAERFMHGLDVTTSVVCEHAILCEHLVSQFSRDLERERLTEDLRKAQSERQRTNTMQEIIATAYSKHGEDDG